MQRNCILVQRQSGCLRYAGRKPTLIRCQAAPVAPVKVLFKITKHVQFGQSLLITGNCDELGQWTPANALALNWSEGHVWKGEVEIPSGHTLEYKYVVKGAQPKALDWQQGANRGAPIPPTAAVVEFTDNWDAGTTKVQVVAEREVTVAVTEAPEAEAEAAPAAASEQDDSIPAPATEVSNGHGHGTWSPVEAVVASNGNGNGHAADVVKPKLANNIVNSPNITATPVEEIPVTAGMPDKYEEASEYQVFEVSENATLTPVEHATSKSKKNLEQLTLNEMKTELKKRGLPSMGNRRDLTERLREVGWL